MKTLVRKLDLNTPIDPTDLVEVTPTMAGSTPSDLGRHVYRFEVARESADEWEEIQGDGKWLTRDEDEYWSQVRGWQPVAMPGTPSCHNDRYRRLKSAWSNPSELRTRLFAAEDEVERLRRRLDKSLADLESLGRDFDAVVKQREEMRVHRDELANELRANLPRWVRIEDELPTEADADTMGNVVIQLNGCHGYARLNALAVFQGGEWLKTKEAK